jgi:hypothetical protein
MLVTFICGCQTKDILVRDNLKTMDMIELDGEGFIICAVHHQRRKGWRSIPVMQMPKTEEIDNPPQYAVWEYSSWTPLEIQDWLLFGEQKLEKKLIASPTELDRRDNRDPQSLVIPVSALDIGGDVALRSTEERPLFEVTAAIDRDPDRSVFREIRNGGSSLHKGRRLQIVYDADMQSRLRERS